MLRNRACDIRLEAVPIRVASSSVRYNSSGNFMLPICSSEYISGPNLVILSVCTKSACLRAHCSIYCCWLLRPLRYYCSKGGLALIASSLRKMYTTTAEGTVCFASRYTRHGSQSHSIWQFIPRILSSRGRSLQPSRCLSKLQSGARPSLQA